jgi:hypothetical protein
MELIVEAVRWMWGYHDVMVAVAVGAAVLAVADAVIRPAR